MRLREFRVRNYRSVNDSGTVRVAERTALVGRNESGKTNLLVALASLNPAEGMEELSFVQDFPRDREVSDFSSDLTVLDTRWDLSAEECEHLGDLFPRAEGIKQINVSRSYLPTCYVGFDGLKAQTVDRERIQRQLTRLRQSLKSSLRQRRSPEVAARVDTALDELATALKAKNEGMAWVEPAEQALEEFDQVIDADDVALPSVAHAALEEIDQTVDAISEDASAHQRAMEWAVEQLPVFIYLSDIPDLDGHHNLSDYARRLEEDRLSEADISLLRLSEVAGFNPLDLISDEPGMRERRQQIIHRAGATITRKIREVWSDRPIKIRFNLDGDHFDTLVSDPTSIYDMEVNLNERSRGFRWFLSLYVLLASDPSTLHGENVLLLLDEPGLHLHALGQRDLLEHFTSGFDSQIIYVTHSPFMIPVQDLASVRTVNHNAEDGTRCSHRPQGDARTLYPIQVAMAYASDEGLFGDQPLVLVANLSDYLFLGAMSAYFISRGEPGLPDDCAVVPMGGLDRAVYMLASFGEHNDGMTLLVNNSEARWFALRELVDENSPLIIMSELAPGALKAGAAIEDLIDRETYHELIRSLHKKAIGRHKFELPPPGISAIDHYQQALADFGAKYDRARIAALFMGKVTSDPKQTVSRACSTHFKKLFAEIDGYLS